MAKFDFVKGYMNYYFGSVEADTEEEARKLALQVHGDALESFGEGEWILISMSIDEDANTEK